MKSFPTVKTGLPTKNKAKEHRMKPTEIQSTSSYDLFRPHGEQRALDPAHIKKLANSMIENGYIVAHPIHAYREGNSYRIIDGHHRHAAAKLAKVDVSFIVTNKNQAGLISVTNQCVKKWMVEDYVRMYASRGMVDYVTLVSYMDRGLPLGLIASLLLGQCSGAGNANKAIVNGTFKIKARAYLDEILRVVEVVAKYNNEGRGRAFISAIAVLLQLDCFSSSIFISRIEANPRSLNKCATREQMFEQIEEIYNFRAREKINLAFLAAERLKSNQEPFGKGAA